jgi:hypothetical protein
MIKRWMYRSASNTQMSPAAGAFFMLIALAVTVYIYHRLIIQTLEYMLIACGLFAAVIAFVALVVSGYRYNRRRTRAVIALEADTMPALDGAPPATPSDQALIQNAADVLADEGVELSWSNDGQTLRAKKD